MSGFVCFIAALVVVVAVLFLAMGLALLPYDTTDDVEDG